MLKLSKNNVSFSRKTWDEIKTDETFRELIELIEDRELLLSTKDEPADFMNFDDFNLKRKEYKNV